MSVDVCPECGSDLQGAPIPEESRQFYSSGATHFSRLIGVELPGIYDGTAYWQCPDCGHRWHRFPPREHPGSGPDRIRDAVEAAWKAKA